MKLDNVQTLYLAALYARSNYGHSVDDVPKPLLHPSMELSDLVDHVCGPLCESDEHYDMFLGEAQSWYDRITSTVTTKTPIPPYIMAKLKETA